MNDIQKLQNELQKLKIEFVELEKNVKKDNAETEAKLMNKIKEVQDEIKKMLSENSEDRKHESQKVTDSLNKFNESIMNYSVEQAKIDTKLDRFTKDVDSLNSQYQDNMKYTRNTMISIVISLIILILTQLMKSFSLGFIF